MSLQSMGVSRVETKKHQVEPIALERRTCCAQEDCQITTSSDRPRLPGSIIGVGWRSFRAPQVPKKPDGDFRIAGQARIVRAS